MMISVPAVNVLLMMSSAMVMPDPAAYVVSALTSVAHSPDVGGDGYRPFTTAYTVTLPVILKAAR